MAIPLVRQMSASTMSAERAHRPMKASGSLRSTVLPTVRSRFSAITRLAASRPSLQALTLISFIKAVRLHRLMATGICGHNLSRLILKRRFIKPVFRPTKLIRRHCLASTAYRPCSSVLAIASGRVMATRLSHRALIQSAHHMLRPKKPVLRLKAVASGGASKVHITASNRVFRRQAPITTRMSSSFRPVLMVY